MLTSLAVQRPFAFPTFLVGLAAGRRQTVADVVRHDRVLRYIQWIGYPVGLASGLVFAASGGTKNLAGQLVSILTSPLFAAAYAAAVLRYFRPVQVRRLAPALPPAGRMFLSNYLG